MSEISNQTQYSDFVVSIKQRILKSQYEALIDIYNVVFIQFIQEI